MSAAVPVLVSRAVELFLAEMVRLSLEAKEGSRHISPSHVRHCIDHNEQFDFLRPLVEHIPTESNLIFADYDYLTHNFIIPS